MITIRVLLDGTWSDTNTNTTVGQICGRVPQNAGCLAQESAGNCQADSAWCRSRVGGPQARPPRSSASCTRPGAKLGPSWPSAASTASEELPGHLEVQPMWCASSRHAPSLAAMPLDYLSAVPRPRAARLLGGQPVSALMGHSSLATMPGGMEAPVIEVRAAADPLRGAATASQGAAGAWGVHFGNALELKQPSRRYALHLQRGCDR